MAATIGIDLGGTKMTAGVVDGAGDLLERVSVPRPRDPEEMATAPVELARRLLREGIVAVGLGVAGLVDWPAGVLVWGPNVVGEKIPYRQLLEEGLGLPAAVDNDANAAALAEARSGAGRSHRTVLMVTLGTGIGGGIVVAGQVFRGTSFAGEIGHMVVDVGGPDCTCGQRGCWETFASGRRLDQMARDEVARDPSGEIARLAAGSIPTGRHLTDAAVAGDDRAAALLADLGVWLGIGMANLIAVLDPDVIVVGGGVSRAGDVVLDPARQSVAAAVEGSAYRSPTPIRAALFGEDATVIGAGMMAGEAVNA